MPPIARTLGLILIFAGPACLNAQTFPPHAPPYRQGEAVRPIAHTHSPQGPVRHASATAPGQAGPNPGTIPKSTVTGWGAIPLAPPSGRSHLPSAAGNPSQGNPRSQNGGLPSPVTVAASLAVVLGIFFLVAWGMRRAAPPGSTALPGEVFEILGRAPMASRQQVHLLRCGKKLLLVSVSQEGTETLTEITDPLEVDRLAGLCQQGHPNSATAAFRQVFGQFAPRRPRADSVSESLSPLLQQGGYDDVQIANDPAEGRHV